ncbi:ubiquitin thioesterase otubain-like isoform X3 [Camellia sinensis]|uniref:ubiquitin thioesterase otubain-like isoform X3 n=1 Tax=Camellia sinensis TaxID=4442 RepID=UPI001036E0B3|nr:ubiquitin thioesterase otubain-like isoform X3 [Camellia sinensis]
MQNQEGLQADAEMASITPIQATEVEDWANFRDDDIMQQQSAIRAVEAEKIPLVGDKEPLSSLAAEYQSGSPILLEKIKVLSEQFDAIRRTRGDGNCFFRSFMFSYLLFLEQLESVLQGNEASISSGFSHDELMQRSRDQSISDYVVMFFRFVTSGEIRKRSEFFEPFILGLTNTTVEQFCKSSVEPMGEESDHVHITAVSDALGVPIRVVYLDRSSCDTGCCRVKSLTISFSCYSVIPHCTSGGSETKPFINLLYRPGHYDILYPK